MFFRETRSKNSKSTVLKLVENIRTDNGPRQRLVVSLGTTFKILKKDRRAVATMVENRLRGNRTSLFDDDPAHVAYADKIIKKIQVEGKWESTREKVQQFKRMILPENNTAPTAHVFFKIAAFLPELKIRVNPRSTLFRHTSVYEEFGITKNQKANDKTIAFHSFFIFGITIKSALHAFNKTYAAAVIIIRF